MILQSVINEISPPICQFPRFIINTISFWIRYTFLKTALLLSCTGDNTFIQNSKSRIAYSPAARRKTDIRDKSAAV